ncbi:MAG: flagellar hook-length control protein FliK [Phycisphaera sp.]|nr:MAG: flagellar hook-length control protein FliK [Phycisphaera sp.]
MNQVTLSTLSASGQNTDPKRDSEASQFRAALEQQSVTLLQTLLDPSQSASLPGAASALAEAQSAEQDVVARASGRLAEAEARQGSRERGLDVSSQARSQLAQKAEMPAAVLDEAAGKAAARATDARSAQPQQSATQADHETGSAPRERTDQSQHARSDQVRTPEVQGNERPTDAQHVSQSGSKRGESAFAAVTRMTQHAASAQSAVNTNTATSVTPASTTAKVSAPAELGEITDRRANAAPGTKQVIKQEPRTFEAQLQRGLAQVLRQKGGTLSLKLTPNELGEVKVSLSLAKGRVDGSIEATNESARGLLEQNIEKLKSSLEQRGITVDRLEVRLAGAGSSERQDAQGQEARANLNQQQADAGGDRHQDSAPGEERQQGTRGGTPGGSELTDLRGAESAADDDAAQGSAAEPLGGWLRLDTLA